MNEMPRDGKALPSLADRLARLQAELDETRRQLAVAQRQHRRPEHRIIDFVGSSPAAQEVKRQARRVAQADATVLLLGEAGTGKALLAQAIHAASRRAARPLVTLDIAAVPRALLEVELFGVAGDGDMSDGAAPGGSGAAGLGVSGTGVLGLGGYSDPARPWGKFGLAEGGTLFLNEIGDLSLPLQAKLLRVLQAQEVAPLGGEPQKVDVRVIAATTRDLAAMVQRGEFRADLYYGLHVLPIRVPALRDRVEDIEPLAEVLLEELSRRGGLPTKPLGASALAALQRRPWPGNVRELRDVLEQAFLAGTNSPVLMAGDLGGTSAGMSGGESSGISSGLSDGLSGGQSGGISGDASVAPLGASSGGVPSTERAMPTFAVTLPAFAARSPSTTSSESGPEESLPLPTLSVRKAQLEREAIANALRRTNGNRVAAARLLAISRATLYEKLARWPELGRRHN
ncbi:regulatory protein, Fis family [Roseateles sp. YR242]|uniref:sigma 54-interacting transcriptional regulator n=1 Tax=Roseateles sp. YR242 TaxID=1855305 RepID=UPI0008C93DD4|nr:sigma 54-interacting transcriptional regulator [Roseateles sp. YR242]SEK65902.1 regulatory protein, Fis family [Roseateles sp. YR242]